jgi:hypothetical protein
MLALQAFISLLVSLTSVNVGAIPLSTLATSFNPAAAANTTIASPTAFQVTNSTTASSQNTVTDREPIIDAAFHITIHPTCQGIQVLQIERALDELHRLVLNATAELLQSPTSEINQLYWGPAGKSDISTPVGVFHQLLYGSKIGVEIRCEDQADQCKDSKVMQAGGYADKDNAIIHLCSDVFSG